jgi:hypothetical protein
MSSRKSSEKLKFGEPLSRKNFHEHSMRGQGKRLIMQNE